MEVVCVELPGRGRRIREPLLRNMDAIVLDIFQQQQHLLHEPYCVFGHSMGALSAFLFVRMALRMGFSAPTHLFLSGRGGPGAPRKPQQRHLLPKAEFLQELVEIGGITPEVAANPEILDFAEPILRADFQASETYVYLPDAPLNVPITVLIGSKEEISAEQAQFWQQETTGDFCIHTFPGDHFFVLRHIAEISNLIGAVSQRSFSH